MGKALLVIGGLFGVGLLLVIMLVIGCISFHNQDTKDRLLVVAKQTDNKSEMDAMWKIIEQNAQVTTEQKNALVEIFNGYAQSRTPEDGGKLMLWVKEAVPNVTPASEVYKQLMNTITAQREGFKFRQKELLDINRVRDTRLQGFPGALYAMICPGDHKEVDVVIVTSTRTENAFKTGKDDDVDLFKKKQ